MTTADAVLDFLQANPDFLTQHPELLPLQAGNVVNFQQAIVHKLRADKERSENRQRMMVDNARTNMTIQARMQAAILRVVEARTFEELIDIINTEVSLMLQVDVANLIFEQAAVANNTAFPSNLTLLRPDTLNEILGDSDALLQANIDGDARVFGPTARLVKSQALLRLNIADGFPDGILAFGSRDPLLFADTQGTDLVGFLADIVERMVRHFIHAGN